MRTAGHLTALSAAALAALSNVHVHEDVCHAVNATRSAFGILFDCGVAGAAGKFDDAMMYLYTDRSGRNVAVVIELFKNLLLNLHVIFHYTVLRIGNPRLRYGGPLWQC